MNTWNTDFHGISIMCTDQLVQIKNDKKLIQFLKDPSTKGSQLIARYAKELYQKTMGKPLRITEDSLAIEILGHVFLDKFAGIASKLKIAALSATLEDIKQRTDIIDCGEKEIDPNRHVWDSLDKDVQKKIIFHIFGDWA